MKHAQALLRLDPMRPGVNMVEVSETTSDMLKVITSMTEDNGDHLRLVLIGLSKKLEKQGKEMRKRALGLRNDVKNELKRGDVVRRDTRDV